MHAAIATVHTTGINWGSVAVIVGSMTGTLSIIFGLIFRSLAKYVANRITDAINKLRIDVISALEARVMALEAEHPHRRRLA